MFKKYFGRFAHAFRGIFFAIVNDFGYRTQIYLGILLSILISIFLSPLSTQEFIFITMAYALVLITELQNSALEAALDRLHPELHNDIKQSKDMAAGAVLIAGIFLLIVLSAIIHSRFT